MAPPIQPAADVCAAAGDLYIETVKGGRFHFGTPAWDYYEIAHALAMQCRYTGHARRFYSVAEHSLLVCMIMMEFSLGDPREGLLHDATEAYLGDVAAPLKALLHDYKRLESTLERKFREWARLPLTITEGCKRADWIALMFEAHYLMPSRGIEWNCPLGVRDQVSTLLNQKRYKLRYLAPAEGCNEFLAALHEYASK